MNTKQREEKLNLCIEINDLLRYADIRIANYKDFQNKWRESMSPNQWSKTMRDIECTERAKVRIRQRLSKVLMSLYADLTPIDEIYNDCNDKVKSIEHQGFFDHPMFYETNENFKNLGL